MTERTKALIDKFEKELEKLPEEEQERCVASYLKDLRREAATEEATQEDPYSALKILRDAKLSGSENASVTYEKELYGPHSESDQ
jgi:hypothetical protein